MKLGEKQLRVSVIYYQMGVKQTDCIAKEGEKRVSTEDRSVGQAEGEKQLRVGVIYLQIG